MYRSIMRILYTTVYIKVYFTQNIYNALPVKVNVVYSCCVPGVVVLLLHLSWNSLLESITLHKLYETYNMYLQLAGLNPF